MGHIGFIAFSASALVPALVLAASGLAQTPAVLATSCHPTNNAAGCRSIVLSGENVRIQWTSGSGDTISSQPLGRHLKQYVGLVPDGEVPVLEHRFRNGSTAVLTWGFPKDFVAAGLGAICHVRLFDSSRNPLSHEPGELELLAFTLLPLQGGNAEALVFSTRGSSPAAVTTTIWIVAGGSAPLPPTTIHGTVTSIERGQDGGVTRLNVNSVKLGTGSSTDVWTPSTLVWDPIAAELKPTKQVSDRAGPFAAPPRAARLPV